MKTGRGSKSWSASCLLSLSIFTYFCLLIATDRRALASVDPTSGLLALQTLASAMAAVGYFMQRHICACSKRRLEQRSEDRALASTITRS
jgi:hypothetical protein